jgi:FtsH-binding integral membrane protein
MGEIRWFSAVHQVVNLSFFPVAKVVTMSGIIGILIITVILFVVVAITARVTLGD